MSLLIRPIYISNFNHYHFIYIFILAHVSALRAGGHVPYDCAFGTPTCGLKKVCDKRKKYPQQVLNTERANSMGV